jgi:hypothetical protein
MGRNDPVYEHVFQFPHGLQFGPQPIAQLPQGCFVFSREKNLFRKETVLYGVEADSGLALQCLGPCAL